MISARPLSLFEGCDKNKKRNDMRDRGWEQLLNSPIAAGNVELRPCQQFASEADRFLTEQELVKRIISGQDESVSWFLPKLKSFVTSVLRDMNIHVQEQNDIFNQVVVKLWEEDFRRLRMWRSDGRGRLASYLGVIVRRAASDWLNHNNRGKRTCSYTLRRNRDHRNNMPEYLDINTIHESDLSPLIATCPLDQVLAREQEKAIKWAISDMLMRDSEILRRRYFNNQSYLEISISMGITPNTVGVVLFRAQKRLREKLWLRYPDMFD